VWIVYDLSYVDRYDGIVTYTPNWDRRHNIQILADYDLIKKILTKSVQDGVMVQDFLLPRPKAFMNIFRLPMVSIPIMLRQTDSLGFYMPTSTEAGFRLSQFRYIH